MGIKLFVRVTYRRRNKRSPWPLMVSIATGIALASIITGGVGVETVLTATIAGIAFTAAVFAIFHDSPDLDERVEINRLRAADAVLKAIIGITATMGGYLVGTRTGTLLISSATAVLAIWGTLILYYNWRDTH